MGAMDYCFLVELAGGRFGFAFCKSDGIELERARAEVARVLSEVKGEETFTAPYLGLLDYREMDREIGRHLHLFEKHDPVWLLLFAKQGEAR